MTLLYFYLDAPNGEEGNRRRQQAKNPRAEAHASQYAIYRVTSVSMVDFGRRNHGVARYVVNACR